MFIKTIFELYFRGRRPGLAIESHGASHAEVPAWKDDFSGAV
jgi:hypothetical protein